ncbi:MAG: hypothetical protein H7Z43_09765 [Clostridia bacterium]|nr:hypothetical protein [Deltaproteobacteria bacterium]
MTRRLVQILVGLVVGLSIAELAFWLRDDRAFPHLNTYLPDGVLGVRLRPGAIERIRFGGNPTTTIRINADGYRGADWPRIVDNAVVVVGDSQVFGLGVEEDEVFTARLAEAIKRPVLNAGVPTFGPPEMIAIIRELMAKEKPRTVVFTVNLANDLFELERPNRERHSVWDGWAVRIETAPQHVTWFPLRGLIMRDSHLVYAARRLLHGLSETDLGALPSEGTWRDMAPPDRAAPAKPTQQVVATELKKQLDATDRAADRLDRELIVWATATGVARNEVEEKLIAARGNSGDIVGEALPMESARPASFTAYELYRTAQINTYGIDVKARVTPETVRKAIEYRESLRRRAGGDPKAGAELTAAQTAWDEALASLHELRRASLAPAHDVSPMDTTLTELAKICSRPACEPVVLILPLDLQVAPEEWRKYDLEPQNLSVASALTERIMTSAKALGMRTIDALPVLAAAEPGAFLQHDIHMTVKGHAAVADALAKALRSPPAHLLASGELPTGRSRVPSAEEFRRTPESIVHGSGKAGCETVRIDEWLRVQCRGPDVRHVSVVKSSGDTMVNANRETMTLVAPLVTPLEAELVWAGRTQRLAAALVNGKLDATFSPPAPTITPVEPVGENDAKLCACNRLIYGTKDCGDVYGSTKPECFASLARLNTASCESLLACAQGFPGALAGCAEESTVAGGTLQCFPLCGDDIPCAAGACVAWPPTSVCLGGQ